MKDDKDKLKPRNHLVPVVKKLKPQVVTDKRKEQARRKCRQPIIKKETDQ